METLLGAMRISSSGMSAERFRMNVISSNIANADSMGVNGGEPYRAREVVLTGDENGVQVAGVQPDDCPFQTRNEPGNPNADSEGNVTYTNVEPIEEMVNMLGASRAYEANIAAFNSAKGMIKNALNIGKV